MAAFLLHYFLFRRLLQYIQCINTYSTFINTINNTRIADDERKCQIPPTCDTREASNSQPKPACFLVFPFDRRSDRDGVPFDYVDFSERGSLFLTACTAPAKLQAASSSSGNPRPQPSHTAAAVCFASVSLRACSTGMAELMRLLGVVKNSYSINNRAAPLYFRVPFMQL